MTKTKIETKRKRRETHMPIVDIHHHFKENAKRRNANGYARRKLSLVKCLAKLR